MKLEVVRLDHIQLCIPKGEEERGRLFYCKLLGFEEIAKPEALEANGGFWLQAGEISIHIGTEEMTGVSKRHPAFEIKHLEKFKSYLIENGIRTKDEKQIPGVNRFSFFDEWNNRIEVLEKV